MRSKAIATAMATLLVAISVHADHTEPCARPGSQRSIANFKDKIKTVVFLIMENRSVDKLMGGQNMKGSTCLISTDRFAILLISTA